MQPTDVPPVTDSLLFIAIKTRFYLLSRSDEGWRLTKIGKDGWETETIYDVRILEHGCECDCPDFIFRVRTARGCKHIRALRENELLT